MPDLNHFDVVVIGGGIAGLSVLRALAPKRRVCLVEREAIAAGQASGRNAAIYRPLERDNTTGALARRSLALMKELSGRPLLDNCGVVLVSDSEQRCVREAQRARAQGVAHELLVGEPLVQRAPWLRGGAIQAGLWLNEGGVLDIHEIARLLEQQARASGATLMLGTGVQELLVHDGMVSGVRLDNGRSLACDHVVVAAGAWSAALGAGILAPLPLTPMRRHLVHLDLPDTQSANLNGPLGSMASSHPVVWRLEEEIYVRPEGAGVLSSPCDEQPWEGDVPREPVADQAALEWLATRMRGLSPALSGAGARRNWACFRTFVPDGELVAGPDPRVPGLHWLCGLGGRGMSVGMAAGELVADRLCGREHPLSSVLGVARLL